MRQRDNSMTQMFSWLPVDLVTVFWLEKNAKVWRRTPELKYLETQCQSCLWKCKTIFGAQITFTRSCLHLTPSGGLWKNMPHKLSLPPTGLASTLHRFRYKLKLQIFNPLSFSFVVSWILFTFFFSDWMVYNTDSSR